MGTKNNPGPIDCYAAAAPDEPIFVLRATDPLAARIVQKWDNLYRERKMLEGQWNDTTEKKYLEAHNCAAEMTEYRKNHC